MDKEVGYERMINMVRDFTLNVVAANKDLRDLGSLRDLLLACSVTLRMGWRDGEWDGLPGREWNNYGAFHL